ncbi:GGDEF domain-containing phosphodiesterase [Ruminococcus sp. NK3A76]|uniref:GGDEF domain-containing phosphodiesterase n=1 Tax=Ruminococcus sp. NK3A76 TaxID=877411 RepID=UPI0004900A85|nr:GGDEF domain-containing phosphodiesterase [Ruminococcus sp. NK3A76]
MDIKFVSLFEKFLEKITTIHELDLDYVESIISDICEYLGISKITVGFYKNPRDEAGGIGRLCVCYDTGEESVPCRTDRIVTETMSVTKIIEYRPAGAREWSDEMNHRVDIFTKVMMLAASRSSLLQVARRRTFYDDDGYLNLNSFMRYIENNGPQGKLCGHAAALLNLKHFSLVNQQIGRDRGTTVMRGFIEGLTELVNDDGIVCRMGGDNFVAVLPLDNLDKCIDHLSGKAVPYNSNGDRIMVNATAGVLVMKDDFVYDAPSSILDRIIPTAQAARTSGMEDILFFSAQMEQRKEKIMRLQRLFPQALEKCEFLTYYQPKVEVRTGKLIGAEALCRWMHKGELIRPDVFIPTFEQSLDICKLDFYMLEHVCMDIRQWLDEGKEVVRISVNLSRKHMVDIDLTDHLVGIIDKYDVPHKYIEIELTETTTDVQFRDLKRVVNDLQKAGISTAVDDFGMGYSSLNLISEIPWNVIKIDKSLIPVSGDDKKSQRSVMFSHIVNMAKDMGYECISEGIETQEQLDAMIEHGCELVQGYFFDRPLPREEFIERLIKGGYDKNER